MQPQVEPPVRAVVFQSAVLSHARKVAKVKHNGSENYFEFNGAELLFLPPRVLIQPGETHMIDLKLNRAGIEYDGALIRMGEKGPQLIGFQKLELGDANTQPLRRFTGLWSQHFLPDDQLVISNVVLFYDRIAAYKASPQGRLHVLRVDPERLQLRA